MTKEEKQKAIAALKKSVPVMAVTSEEYEDYIRTLNKIIDWLEQPETVTEFDEKNSELKPCPFCGTNVELLKEPLWHGNHGYHDCFDFKVRCPKCGCTVDYTHNDTIYRSEEEAIANVVKTWNERAKENYKSLCDSCVFKVCIFRSGIVMNHCDFYKSESEG